MKNVFLIFLTIFVFKTSEAQLCDKLLSQEDVSTQCKTQLDAVCNDEFTIWKMFDASSKYPPSGLAYSNNEDVGNFDECMSIKLDSGHNHIQAKYCGLSVLVTNSFPYKFHIYQKQEKIIQVGLRPITGGKSVKDSNIEARSEKVLLSAALSVCIPEACNTTEVAPLFIQGLLDQTNKDGFPIVNVIDTNCMKPDSNSTYEWGTILFIIFICFIALSMIVSTCYELICDYYEREPGHEIFLAFSVYSNGQKLFKISAIKNPKQIYCLNGLRAISMLWVICGHNFADYLYEPIINQAEFASWTDHIWIMYVVAAPIAVDTFFFLSGLLFTISFLKAGEKLPTKKQILGLPMMVLHRYLRITPAVAVLYFGFITIFPMTGTGPFWDDKIMPVKHSCEKYWWSFFLYLQNYVNYKDADICFIHTWYLSADMQMFILAPLVLIPTSYFLKRNRTKVVLAALFVFTVIWVGIPILQQFQTDSDNGFDTHSRLNVYLFGIMLGVIFFQYQKKPFYFSKMVNFILWIIVLSGSFGIITYFQRISTHYERVSNILFYRLYRPLWSCFLGYMVYSCHKGFGGPINWLLSLPICQIVARLSYCMYLLHIPVSMYWFGSVRTQLYWGDYQIFYTWCGHFLVTLILATIWSLAFELPMIVIEKCIFGSPSSMAKSTKKDEAA